MDNTDFWNRVKELMKEQKINQESLCSSINISIGTMRGWITHSRLPDAEQAVKIASALGTTVEYLVTGEYNEPYLLKYESLADTLKKIVKEL